MPVSTYSCEPSPSLPDTAASLCDIDPSLCDTEVPPRLAVEIDRSSVSHPSTIDAAFYLSTNRQSHDADTYREQGKDPWDDETDVSDFDYLAKKNLGRGHRHESSHDEEDEPSEKVARKGPFDPESQASTGRRKWTVSDFIPSIVMLGFATVIAVPVGLKATGHLKSS
jgi:hypothetical protein